jgi:hypothetical protein
LAGVLIAPAIAIAQASAVRRIGLLSLGDPGVSESERKRFWEPARKLGWIEGQNLNRRTPLREQT